MTLFDNNGAEIIDSDPEGSITRSIQKQKDKNKKFKSAKPLIFNGQLKEAPGLYAYDL
jgi:hypothetical protein